MLNFGTKAETLNALETGLKYAQVLSQIRFSVENWKQGQELTDFPDWARGSVIVRSSAQSEDTANQSQAGHYTSISDVNGSDNEELTRAIETVIASFDGDNLDDQVLIQPMLDAIQVSGVFFTRDPSTGGHYYVVNYDDTNSSIGTVTDGSSNQLKAFYQYKNSTETDTAWLSQLLKLGNELESLFNNDSLDIEFAIDSNDSLVLLQVRPLILSQAKKAINYQIQQQVINEVGDRFRALSYPHPYLLGRKSIFGVMPDWNPAEIIGTRPKPLTLSLYKELVTDSTWAYQRDNYGYRNLRSFPLLISFGGLPYIDVRVSFNSFIPDELDDDLAGKLVDYYLDRLIENPNHHDKIEFEIIFSCFTLDLEQKIQILKEYNFTDTEIGKIISALNGLTNNIINEEGLWKQDINKLKELEARHQAIMESQLPNLEKIYWLLEYCRRYGTLPFAGLARAGFIAVQLLKSVVETEILTEDDYQKFLSSLNSVSTSMKHDLASMDKAKFLQKYGHLRPGTYDILSPRYDETPESYFDRDNISVDIEPEQKFVLCLEQIDKLAKLLKEQGLEHDVLSFFDFIKSAIEGREYSKFIFTKTLSDVLVLVSELGAELDIDVEELSYLDIGMLKSLYASSGNLLEAMKRDIDSGKQKYAHTSSISLPPLITSAKDIYSFELPENTPNYITLAHARGRVVTEEADHSQLRDAILIIPSADPGYDWVFSHNIAGFITMFGGVNSHMAIRAGELGIPAVIGAGEVLYNQWSKASMLELDCRNRQVHILK